MSGRPNEQLRSTIAPHSATLFVWEAVTAGCCESASASLMQEGRAMWRAVVEDLLRIDRYRIATLWHESAGPLPLPPSERLRVHHLQGTDKADQLFDQLAADCDRSWIIAPELDGLLVDRLQQVERVGGRAIGPDIPATQLCADKLQLARHLREQRIPTPETISFSSSEFPDFPAVIKRRDGAGSCGCRRIRTQDAWNAYVAERERSGERSPLIVQPFLAGAAVSAAAIISGNRGRIDVFPTGRQLLSDDDTLDYRGGEIPLQATGDRSAIDREIGELVRRTAAIIPGLRGYVGFDLLLPDDGSGPVLIEINPRLTTAYVGYRALTDDNLAARVIAPQTFTRPIAWQPGSVRFTPDGRCIRTANAL